MLSCGKRGSERWGALIHAGTPAHYVAQVMADLFGWPAATDLHPLLASCIFRYEFEFVYPFADGNGRTDGMRHAFLLARWRLVFAWLSVESIVRRRQQGYYAVISQPNAAGSSEIFVEFMLEAFRGALLPYVQPEEEVYRRENDALDYFSRNSSATVIQLAVEFGCSKRSAKCVVADPCAQERLVREGSARADRWVVNQTEL